MLQEHKYSTSILWMTCQLKWKHRQCASWVWLDSSMHPQTHLAWLAASVCAPHSNAGVLTAAQKQLGRVEFADPESQQ